MRVAVIEVRVLFAVLKFKQNINIIKTYAVVNAVNDKMPPWLENNSSCLSN